MLEIVELDELLAVFVGKEGDRRGAASGVALRGMGEYGPSTVGKSPLNTAHQARSTAGAAFLRAPSVLAYCFLQPGYLQVKMASSVFVSPMTFDVVPSLDGSPPPLS